MMSTANTPPECPHTNWLVTDYCVVGFGYCPDCKQQIPQTTLFNNLKARMLEAMAAVNPPSVTKPLPHHMSVPLRDGARLNQDYWNGYIDGLRGAANEVEKHWVTEGQLVYQKHQADSSATTLRQIANDLEDAQ